MPKVLIPALPTGAVGYVTRRPDRPECLALFRPDGSLSNTWGRYDGIGTVAMALAAGGFLHDQIADMAGSCVWAVRPAGVA